MSFKIGDRVTLTGSGWSDLIAEDIRGRVVTISASAEGSDYYDVEESWFPIPHDAWIHGDPTHRWGGTSGSPEQTPRAEALTKAADLIDGDREAVYGDPLVSHERIGKLWSALLGVEINAHQVAMMMAAMKLSRLAGQAEHKDSWIDLAGYAGLGYEFVVRGE